MSCIAKIVCAHWQIIRKSSFSNMIIDTYKNSAFIKLINVLIQNSVPLVDVIAAWRFPLIRIHNVMHIDWIFPALWDSTPLQKFIQRFILSIQIFIPVNDIVINQFSITILINPADMEHCFEPLKKQSGLVHFPYCQDYPRFHNTVP